MENKKEVTAEQVAEHLPFVEKVEIAQAYLDTGITASDDPADIADEIVESYAGKFDSDVEFAEYLVTEVGELPKDIPAYVYIDWERTAGDIMMDYTEQDGFYFRNV